MKPRLLGLFLGLFGLIALTAWLSDTAVTPQQAEAVLDEQPHTADFYMQTYDALIMDERGLPSHRVISPKLTHYADDDTTELEQPFVTVFRDIGAPWQINSQRGWVAADNKLVLMSGDVRMDRAGTTDNPPMKLRTERLRVIPDDDYAETDKPVTMQTDRQQVQANGMRAYMANNQIQLLGEVTSHYD
jgi:lipopolysaccharide export system protein LptC